MKYLLTILIGIGFAVSSYAKISLDEPIAEHEAILALDTTILNPAFDKELADQLGADDYGMKGYMLVMLKTGTNPTTDSEFVSRCFRGHLNNISSLVEAGKLVVAGPLGANEKKYRGIFILNVTSREEADTLLQSDPAIRENLLDYDLYSWYGSAALPVYLDASDKIWKSRP